MSQAAGLNAGLNVFPWEVSKNAQSFLCGEVGHKHCKIERCWEVEQGTKDL